MYSFPGLELQFVLRAHRAAVNAVSISESRIVSASGDRSVRLWDAKTGKLLRTLENHHTRGYVRVYTLLATPNPLSAQDCLDRFQRIHHPVRVIRQPHSALRHGDVARLVNVARLRRSPASHERAASPPHGRGRKRGRTPCLRPCMPKLWKQ